MEKECLEEPGDVRKVPLRGTRLGDALHLIIVEGQRLAKVLGSGPGATVLFNETGLRQGLGIDQHRFTSSIYRGKADGRPSDPAASQEPRERWVPVNRQAISHPVEHQNIVLSLADLAGTTWSTS